MSHARSEYAELQKIAPDVYEAVLALGQVAEKAGFDKQLLKLVKIRASQINGCAFCLQHHVLQAERLGLSADKINLVAVWREAPIFSPRERAALAWTEALTFVPDGVSDAVYEEARREFYRLSGQVGDTFFAPLLRGNHFLECAALFEEDHIRFEVMRYVGERLNDSDLDLRLRKHRLSTLVEDFGPASEELLGRVLRGHSLHFP